MIVESSQTSLRVLHEESVTRNRMSADILRGMSEVIAAPDHHRDPALEASGPGPETQAGRESPTDPATFLPRATAGQLGTS